MQTGSDPIGAVSPEERRRRLIDRLHRDGRLVAAEIMREFAVSEDTARRDLNELAASGLVERVHGGALPVKPSDFAARERAGPQAKSRIATRAAALIEDGQVVFLDSGTTLRAIAGALPGQLRATIVTTNLPLALDLCNHASIEVVLIGGRLSKRERAVTGISAFEAIAGTRADLCLLGVCGLDPMAGITAEDADEARIKRAMIDASQSTYALADASKLGGISAFRVGPLDILSGIVVDADTPRDKLDGFAARGLNILVA